MVLHDKGVNYYNYWYYCFCTCTMFACFNIFVCMLIGIINILLMCLTLTLKFLWSASQKSQEFVIHHIFWSLHHIYRWSKSNCWVSQKMFQFGGFLYCFASCSFCRKNILLWEHKNIWCNNKYKVHTTFTFIIQPWTFSHQISPICKSIFSTFVLCLVFFSNWFPSGLTTFSSAVSFVII